MPKKQSKTKAKPLSPQKSGQNKTGEEQKRRMRVKRSPINGDRRDVFISAVLAVVPTMGWTEQAMADAAHRCGFDSRLIDTYFPNGIEDVVLAWSAELNRSIEGALKELPGFSRMRVRDRIGQGIRLRLTALEPHKDAVRRLWAWGLWPSHGVLLAKALYATCDGLWCAVGDMSTDYNYHTKRALLFVVLKATFLYWLADESLNHDSTFQFLDRRLGEIVRAGKTISLLKEMDGDELRGLLKRWIAFS